MKESAPRPPQDRQENRDVEEERLSTLLAKGETGVRNITRNYKKLFTTITRSEVANRIIDAGYAETLSRGVHEVGPLDPAIAERLVAMGHARTVAYNLDWFRPKSYNHPKIGAKTIGMLVDAGYTEQVVKELDAFELDTEVADKMIKAGHRDYVVFHKDAFKKYIDNFDIDDE